MRKNKVEEIKHMDNRLIQGERPICGIYAFLNGILSDENINNDDCCLNCTINSLWNLALTDDIEGHQSNIFCAKHYSLIGEFFSSEKLENFLDLNSNKEKICLELNRYNENIVDYNVEPLECKNITDYECLKKYIDKKEGEIFYLIPINTSRFGKNKNNLHWICLKRKNGKYYIYNSADNYKGNEKKAKPCKKEIKTFSMLYKSWENITQRDQKYFYFTRWAYCQNIRKLKKKYCLPTKYYCRLHKIRHSWIKSSFENSQFDILQITVNRSKPVEGKGGDN